MTALKSGAERAQSNRPPRNIFVFLLLLVIVFHPCAAQSAAGKHPSPAGPRLVQSWPVILGNGIHATPVVADINRDGRDEIAVTVEDGRVFLLDSRGRVLAGWPQAAASYIYVSPLLSDINGDGNFEVVAGSWDGRLYAWGADGRHLPGWPVDLGSKPVCAPKLVTPQAGSEPSIMVACRDGSVHLLDPNGANRSGWPRHGGRQAAPFREMLCVVSADLNGDAKPEILYLSLDDAVLYAWSSAGGDLAGSPRELGGTGVGIAVDDRGNPKRIACTTTKEVVVIDTGGRQIMRLGLRGKEDTFSSPPAFFSSGASQNNDKDLLAAATQGGAVYIWDRHGRLLPGWPIQLGGFVYGIAPDEQRYVVLNSPQASDVDGDGEPEILICSYDHHLYCFDLDGKLVHGWPVTLEDSIMGGLAFAQLDGVGREEIVVGQVGETLFAYHLEAPAPERGAKVAHRPDLYSSGEWLRLYSAVAVCVAVLLVLLVARLRSEVRTSVASFSLGPGGWSVVVLFALLLIVRVVLFAGEAWRYVQARGQLGRAQPIIAGVLENEQEWVQDKATAIAAGLDSCKTMDLNDPMQLLYWMERLAGQHRLDYEYSGLLATDESGGVLQALGLARGWSDLAHLGISIEGEAGPIMLGATPVFVGSAQVGTGEEAGYLFLFSSLLNTFPHALADATGVSAHIRLEDRTLAWAGAPPPPSVHAWPWLGIVEPSQDISISDLQSGRKVFVRLAKEDYAGPWQGWMDLAIVLLLPLLYYSLSARQERSFFQQLNWRWIVLFGLTYTLGWVLLSGGELIQRPVPIVGHCLEFLLHLAGLLGVVVVLRALIGVRRGRRLSFALLGSYLLVGLLPLTIVMLITTNVIQRAHRRVIQDTVAGLEERADNILMAYSGNPNFVSELRSAARDLADRPVETRWHNVVGEDQLFFTYDLPSAYLTFWCEDPDDPSGYFTGFSYRAPRTQKFFARRPAWMGDGNLKGLFLEGGNTVIRAIRRLRTPDVQAELVSHIPLDQAIHKELENRLRLLPFLPRVRLQPAWVGSSQDQDISEGWLLPFGTKLVLPARDWTTGAPRWIVYRARAFLPAGREMWTVLLALIIVATLPLALSVWGAYFTFQRTVRPLTRLLTGIRRVETGDLEYRLADAGQSEIALAARAFDRMAESLKTNVQELAEKKKVEEVSELKSRFISMVGHDLKTPLSSIKGAAENVLSGLTGPITDRQRKYLEMILSSSENLQKMIADLLDLSHIESGRLTLNIEVLDLRREADNVLRSIRPLLDRQSLRTRITATAEHTKVHADRTRLWQILNNIISNAMRYSPEGGCIDITIDDAPAMSSDGRRLLRITIADQGPGVPEEELSRLFEPFYSRPAGPWGKRGAGLGLAIVKHLVELHGGGVSLSSNDQGGASVSFTLPKVVAE